MPTDGVICCRYSHKYKALSPNVQLFLCWAKKLSQNKFQSTWARRCLWPGILQVENVRSAENAANNAWFAIWGNHCRRRMRHIVHLDVVVRRTRHGCWSNWRFERFWLLSSSSAYMTRDRLRSLRHCRIEVRDEMHPCQPGRMKWCRYEVGAARLVTNWCTAKLCIMHIHLPCGDDVKVMIVTETQRPRKSEREKNENDHCIFQRRVLSTTWCDWGLRMQQSRGAWWSSSRAGSRPPPSPRSIVPRLTARNSIPLNAMQCNSIPFNAEFHSPQTLVTPTDLRWNCIGREHLWQVLALLGSSC